MRTSISLQALFLLALVAAVPASATAQQASSTAQSARFLDGPRHVSAVRLGPATQHASGRTLTPVRLRYDNPSITVDVFIDHTAVVRLAPGIQPAFAQLGLSPIKPLMPSIGLWLVKGNADADGLDVARRLQSDDARQRGVQYAIPNLYLKLKPTAAPYTPNDPDFGGQWYFENLKMSEAWALSRGDPNTSIVVVDSGCDMNHPDLVSKMDEGLDVVDGDNDPTYDPAYPGTAHGTACAGLVAADTDNALGIAGGCPLCRVRCVRLLSDLISPITATVDAFEFALQVNASVVSNSWGYVDPIPVPQAIADAINNLFQNGRGGQGALVLFAAGNDDREIGDNELQAVQGVFNIGAINNLDAETPFTNFGNSLDLVAPTGTFTTDISGPEGYDSTDYTNSFGGTSSACPVAAGIAGLLASAGPDKTSAQLYDTMIKTARSARYAQPDENGHDPLFGYGIIEPVAALNDVLGIQPTQPAPQSEEASCACSTLSPTFNRVAVGLYLAGLVALRARKRRRTSAMSKS